MVLGRRRQGASEKQSFVVAVVNRRLDNSEQISRPWFAVGRHRSTVYRSLEYYMVYSRNSGLAGIRPS